MKTIPLTFGMYALVDDEDYEALSKFKWQCKQTRSGGYARRGASAISMARQIVGAKPGDVVDHINGNTLDNRKENLRICTQQLNQRNRRQTRRGSSSQYKGVSFCSRTSRWRARITIDHGKTVFLGRFDSPQDAAKAYDSAAQEHFGAYARLNEEIR